MKKLLIFLSLLALSSFSFAEESDCSLNKDGRIKQISFAICEDDIANKYLKGILGKEYSEDFTEIFVEKEVDKEAIGEDIYSTFTSQSSKDAYKELYIFIWVVAGIILAYTIFQYVLNYSRGELENLSIKKQAFSLGLFLILTAGGTQTGYSTLDRAFYTVAPQLSIALNNAMMRLVASELSNTYLYEAENENFNSKEGEITQQSKALALNYVQAQLCTRINTNYIFNRGLQYLNSENINKNIDCVFAPKNRYQTNFGMISDPKLKKVAYKKIVVSPVNQGKNTNVNESVIFERKDQNAGECSLYKNFECLTLSINVPQIESYETSQLAERIGFWKNLKTILNSVSVTENNKSRIYSNFEQIIEKAVQDNDGVLNKELSDKLKILATVYYNYVQNALTIGYTEIETNSNSTTALVKNSTTASLDALLERADRVADHILNFQCTTNPAGLSDTQKTAEYLNALLAGEEDIETPNLSSQCLSYGSEFGHRGQVFELNDEEQYQQAKEYQQQQVSSAIEEFNDLSRVIFEARKGVKEAFFQTISELDNESFWKKISQQGGFGFIKEIINISKQKNASVRLINYFNEPLFYSSKKFDEDLLSYSIEDDKEEKEQWLYRELELLKFLKTDFNSDNEERQKQVATMRNTTFSSLDQTTGEKSGYHTSEEIYKDVIKQFQNLDKDFLKAMNIEITRGVDEDGNVYDCIKNDCSIDDTLPIIKLTDYGHQGVNLMTNVYAYFIGLKASSNLAYKAMPNKVSHAYAVVQYLDSYVSMFTDILFYLFISFILLAYGLIFRIVWVGIIRPLIMFVISIFVFSFVLKFICLMLLTPQKRDGRIPEALLYMFWIFVSVILRLVFVFIFGLVLFLLFNVLAGELGSLFIGTFIDVNPAEYSIKYFLKAFIVVLILLGLISTVLTMTIEKLPDLINTLYDKMGLPGIHESDSNNLLQDKGKNVMARILR